MTALDKASDLRNRLHVIRFAAAFAVGADENNCRDFIQCIMTELIQIDDGLDDLIDDIDQLELENLHYSK